jgi:hypothetical protein
MISVTGQPYDRRIQPGGWGIDNWTGDCAVVGCNDASAWLASYATLMKIGAAIRETRVSHELCSAHAQQWAATHDLLFKGLL